MAIKISSNIVINNSKDVILGGFNSDPGGVSAGAIHFNRGLGVIRAWNGTSWTTLTEGASTTQAWAWGYNAAGRLGTLSTANSRSSPVSVVGSITDWTFLTAGHQRSAGIQNGFALTWGDNSTGVLGVYGLNRSSPTSILGGFSDWVQISCGNYHMVGLRANGTAWGWGYANQGQIGNNIGTVSRSSPVSVVGAITDWFQISAGGQQTHAIRANGTAWGWGWNGFGQLGDNTSQAQSSPVSVVGNFTDWTQISGGKYHTAAIRANGTAWTWGYGTNGELGNNSFITRSSPVSVVGGFTDWVQISAANGGNATGRHTAAVRSNGTAWCWGTANNGVLGNNTGVTNRSSPVEVSGGFTDWVQISAANDHTAGVRSNGSAWCWGRNAKGQLGDNSSINRSSPVSVVGFSDWIQVAAAGQGVFGGHTVGLRSTS